MTPIRTGIAHGLRRLAAVGLVAAAASPLAVAQTSPADTGGILSYPNVRVLNIPTTPRITLPTEGVKAFIDAETGALAEPSFEQLEELQRARGHRKPDPKARTQVRTLANGALLLHAPSSMINLSVARIGDGGRLDMACTPSDGLATVFHVNARGEGRR